jgi:hypothetical protein
VGTCQQRKCLLCGHNRAMRAAGVQALLLCALMHHSLVPPAACSRGQRWRWRGCRPQAAGSLPRQRPSHRPMPRRRLRPHSRNGFPDKDIESGHASRVQRPR